MYYIYVLKSDKNSRFYTGYTSNLKRRIQEHNDGLSKYTKLTKPFKLMYYETASSRGEAITRERFFKTGKGREEIQKTLRGRSSAG